MDNSLRLLPEMPEMPEAAENWRGEGEELPDAKNLAALKLQERSLRQMLMSFYLLMEQQQTALMRGDYEEAVALAERAFFRAPGFYRTMLHLARLYLLEKRRHAFSDALDALGTLSGVGPLGSLGSLGPLSSMGAVNTLTPRSPWAMRKSLTSSFVVGEEEVQQLKQHHQRVVRQRRHHR